MPVRTRRRSTAAAVALTAGITAGATLLLSGCGPADGTAGGPGPSASSTGTGTGTGTGSGSSSTTGGGAAANGSSGTKSSAPAAVPAALNGTAHNGLTISDGSRYVVMNGTRVDFGTQVRDLAWSPDGGKAAFIDGDGDLAVSGPDGGGRVVVAKNPGDQNWSHPTWQVRAHDTSNGIPALDEILFAGRKNNVSQIYSVSATGVGETPTALPLHEETGPGEKPLPQTGNAWPSAGGTHGKTAYANSGTGDVYLRDDYLREQAFDLAAGSEPALPRTSDGEVVFVRSTEGHDHLFLERSTDTGVTFTDLTPHATTDYTEPAWSPDGSTIAARTTEGVVTLPADGSAAPVKVSGYHGLPAYRG